MSFSGLRNQKPGAVEPDPLHQEITLCAFRIARLSKYKRKAGRVQFADYTNEFISFPLVEQRILTFYRTYQLEMDQFFFSRPFQEKLRLVER